MILQVPSHRQPATLWVVSHAGGYTHVIHLLLPLMLKSGIATAEEVAIDILAERLPAE